MKAKHFKLSVSFILFAALFCLCGCSKDDDIIAYYKYEGLQEMYYIQAEEDIARAFFTELGNIMDEYDGEFFTESTLTSEINKVVKRYDNGVVAGTFSLVKSTKSKVDGPWKTVRSWTMEFAPEYR